MNKATYISVFALKIVAAFCSMYLTIQFMRGLGEPTGSSNLFAVLGFLFDACKLLFPALALSALAKKELFKFALLGFVSLVLVCLSGLASVQALESASNASVMLSNQYKAIEEKISIEKARADELRRINRITAAGEIDAKVLRLIDEKANIRPDTVTSRYTQEISVTVALILELISLSLSAASSREEDTHQVRFETVEDEKRSYDSSTERLGKAESLEEQIRSVLPMFESRISQTDLKKLGITSSGSRLREALVSLQNEGVVKKQGRFWMVANEDA